MQPLALIKEVGGVGRRQQDRWWCEGVVQCSRRNQSAATPGSCSLLGDSAAFEVRALLAAGSGAAAAEAQRPRGRRGSRTPCTTHTLTRAALRLYADPFPRMWQAVQVAWWRHQAGERSCGRRIIGGRWAGDLRLRFVPISTKLADNLTNPRSLWWLPILSVFENNLLLRKLPTPVVGQRGTHS